MQTKILSVDVEWNGAGSKKWGKAIVKHDGGGKGERTQQLVSFKNPDVFKKVQELVGQTVEVENVKEGDFWTWKSINAAGASSGTNTPNPAATSTTRVSGSNYETKEERAARQVLIVKQSSLSSAIGALTPGAKGALKPDEVLDLAQRFADWVFATDTSPPKDMSIENMTDDIPY